MNEAERELAESFAGLEMVVTSSLNAWLDAETARDPEAAAVICGHLSRALQSASVRKPPAVQAILERAYWLVCGKAAGARRKARSRA